MATATPPTETTSDKNEMGSRIECDHCYDYFSPEFMVYMDGIADGQTWCKNCHEEFGVFCGRLDR
ncbi:hypothetical protein QCD60_29380 [Pokkaliibacter sp. MBI-7]|uniref:hypothetical protein n=1 Tax=Pokkaliibacter sp. MBI-7 TaxID=3040600 RepID=UPI00244B83AA|nr:hypothetical protein [Pokkaliibacter sp. MBI-7]MDH2434821.1 hypothetical protein [Pokkaliibacter sp. MBI-7]MDH2436629.1 hypothetical protein [Pokkaliibacter sp. MBI-7]